MADFNVKTLEADLDFEHLPYWDVVIVGAGPAGLAAGLTTAHRALTTLIIEAKDSPGGQPHFLYADKRIVDIPGFPDGITGEELSERTYRQAVNALVQFRFNEELQSIEDTDELHDNDPLKRVEIHVLGQTSVLGEQPEFASSDKMRRLLTLTESNEHLTEILRRRHVSPGVSITIGNEHGDPRFENFTIVTSEYRAGSLAGVIGVIGPTRMPYEKVIAVVTHASRLVSDLLD